MSTSFFQYTSLPRNSIRLLTVIGQGLDGTIECTLNTTELTESLQFYALSYAWGSTVANRRTSCNGNELAVSQSLHDAIQALLPKLVQDELPICINAVCINQLDHDEKEREVQRMDDIYSSAKKVLVWLGPEAPHTLLIAAHGLPT